MKRRNTYVGAVLLLAVLMLGIGYAAMSNITLNINGSASATVEDENFKVKFTGTPTVSNATNVVAEVEEDHKASITVTGLTAKGDSETATYTIENASEDLSAELAIPSISNDNTEYFKVTTDMDAAKTITAGTTTTVTVTVELVKTPIESNQKANIDINIDATPVQP